MDLIHPPMKVDVAAALRECSRDGKRVLVVGGRTHVDKGNPCEVDAELWMTQLNRLVAYEPAEMVAVVEAGMRFGALDRLLAENQQEWSAAAPEEATVGGIIAAAVNSPRRLTVGPVRDSVLEVELVTGDGRLVRGGARTVKNATGYDLPRLVAGSLGTLGAIVQVALRLRPRPKARRTLVWQTDQPIDLGLRLLDGVPLPTAVLAMPQSVELRLEGWPEAVAAQADAALEVAAGFEDIEHAPFPVSAPWLDEPVVAEASTHPSGIAAAVGHAGDRWGALLGVGIVWAGLPADGEALARLRAAVPLAPVIKGPGGLGSAPPARAIRRRLKASFDPAGILAPGRFWGNV